MDFDGCSVKVFAPKKGTDEIFCWKRNRNLHRTTFLILFAPLGFKLWAFTNYVTHLFSLANL